MTPSFLDDTQIMSKIRLLHPKFFRLWTGAGSAKHQKIGGQVKP